MVTQPRCRRATVLPSRAPRPADAPFLVAARARPARTPPVWFMRQAGRSLPEYRALRAGTGMLEACLTPRPGHRDHPAAGPPARRRRGDPVLRHRGAARARPASTSTSCPAPVRWSPQPVRTAADVERLPPLEPDDVASVADAVRLLVAELGDDPADRLRRRAVHAGRYLVEGGPSQTTQRTKALMYGEPERLARAAATGSPTSRRVPAGAGRRRGRRRAAVRLVGRRAVASRLPRVRAAALGRACSAGLADAGRAADPLRRRHRRAAAARWREAGADVVGVDWRVPLDEAARRVGPGRAAAGQPRPGRAVRRPWPAVEARGPPGARARAAPRPGTSSTSATACCRTPTRTC